MKLNRTIEAHSTIYRHFGVYCFVVTCNMILDRCNSPGHFFRVITESSQGFHLANLLHTQSEMHLHGSNCIFLSFSSSYANGRWYLVRVVRTNMKATLSIRPAGSSDTSDSRSVSAEMTSMTRDYLITFGDLPPNRWMLLSQRPCHLISGCQRIGVRPWRVKREWSLI